MPELPEVEITARLLSEALRGARVTAAVVTGVGRRGKHLVVGTDGGLTLLMHLMSAGRLQLYDSVASARDRTVRLALTLADGRQLRLREFGSRQAAWAKLLPSETLDADEALAKLGPEAWPEPPPLAALLAGARPLHTVLRDQRVIAGIGRAWADEILWGAQLSPYKRGGDLSATELGVLRETIVATLGGALEHYEGVLSLPIPDKLPLPLQIHAHQGKPCPRCERRLEAVHLEDHVIAYCPDCQTAGRTLADRRLSRLLR